MFETIAKYRSRYAQIQVEDAEEHTINIFMKLVILNMLF